MSHKFVVGLGNPGRQYQQTRHNVGFEVLRILQQRWLLGEGQPKFEGLCWQTRRNHPDEGEVKVTLLAPMKYMNCSGRPTASMLKFYKADPKDLLVILDDIALPLGQLRFRPEGSPGGHNGMKDIQRVLGTNAIARLRVGIGNPPGQMDSADYVLGKFRPHEQEEINIAVQRAADAVEAWLSQDIPTLMERFNQKV